MIYKYKNISREFVLTVVKATCKISCNELKLFCFSRINIKMKCWCSRSKVWLIKNLFSLHPFFCQELHSFPSYPLPPTTTTASPLTSSPPHPFSPSLGPDKHSQTPLQLILSPAQPLSGHSAPREAVRVGQGALGSSPTAALAPWSLERRRKEKWI